MLPAEQAVAPILCGQCDRLTSATLGIPAWRPTSDRARGRGGGTALLVSGGAGSVSQYAIEFAKARGATVISTISSAEKAAAAREGVDHCIEYSARTLENV